MKKVEMGFTNKNKYIDGDVFIIEKTKNGFNHRFDYNILKEFDFAPKVVEDSEDVVKFEYIKGEILTNPTGSDLITLGSMLRKLHKSTVKLPQNNLRDRIRWYLSVIHAKKLHVPEIEDNWSKMNKLISQMNRINPSHNDLWMQNIIKTKENKLFIVDWEYATMGDKHFDLAYYIEAQQLNEEQEAIFLASYNSSDDFQAWIPEWMPRYKMFVNWLGLIWALHFPEAPFDVTKLKKRINELKNIK